MIHAFTILFICSIYVLTFIIERKLYLGNTLLAKFNEYITTLSFIGKFLLYTWAIVLFIFFSPINFLIILINQIIHYGKD